MPVFKDKAEQHIFSGLFPRYSTREDITSEWFNNKCIAQVSPVRITTGFMLVI